MRTLITSRNLRRRAIFVLIFSIGVGWGGPFLFAGFEEGANAVQGDDSAEKNPFSLRATSLIGYDSNLLQVAASQAPIGDWFSQSTLDLAFPLDGKNGLFAATLAGSSKLFFEHSALDEYAFTPGLFWNALAGDDATLKLNIHGGRFQERIYTEGEPLPDRAFGGWSAGTGWDFEDNLSPKTSLSWTGDAGYHVFDSVTQDNFLLDTGISIATQEKENLKLISGLQWSYQNYRDRPFEIISTPLNHTPPNPSSLQLLAGRASEGFEWGLGSGWTLETTVLAGPNLDLTNGYYNAAVVGGHFGLRWEAGKWTVHGSFDPEFDWYGKRPANLNDSNPKLCVQQCLFSVGLEYAWTEHVHLICTNSIQRQDTNSPAVYGALNSFTDSITTAGASFAF